MAGKRLSTIMAVALTCQTAALSDQRTVRVVATDRAADCEKTWGIVAEDSWSERFITARFEDFLRTSSARLAIFILVTSQDDFELLYRGKGMTDHSYEDWATQYQEVRNRSLRPVAQLMKIGANAGVRMVDGEGERYEKVLRGSNPMVMSIRGRKYELLNFHVFRPGEARDGTTIHFNVFTQSALSKSRGRDVLNHLKKETGGMTAVVRIRRDRWFIDDPVFPILWVFDRSARPPGLTEVRSNPTLLCHDAGCEWSPFQ